MIIIIIIFFSLSFLSPLSSIPSLTTPPTLSYPYHPISKIIGPLILSSFFSYFILFFLLLQVTHLSSFRARIFFPFFPIFLLLLLSFFFTLAHTHYHFLLRPASFLFPYFLHSLSPLLSHLPLISFFLFFITPLFFSFPKNSSILTIAGRTIDQLPPTSHYQLTIISHWSLIFFLSHNTQIGSNMS